MERTLTLDDLREFEQYPGLAVDRKAHFSRFANKTIVHRDYHRNYTLMTYILLFFIFAFIGWIWEVGIHIVEDGVFVNRGTMFGPWLPIYGFGGVRYHTAEAVHRPPCGDFFPCCGVMLGGRIRNELVS